MRRLSISEWLARSQIRQRPRLAVYAGMLVLVTIVITVMVLNWLGSRSSDRLAVISNLLSFGTLLLALVAGIVALAAYSAATGLPELTLQFRQAFGVSRRLKFVPGEDGHALENTIVTFSVTNSSSYAARSPAIIAEFHSGVIQRNQLASSREWIPITDPTSEDITAVQWDGGPNYAIHGKSTRYLPELNLRGLYALRPDVTAYVSIRLLADGYTREPIDLRVEFTDDLSEIDFPGSL